VSENQLPLSGLRVIDVTRALSGPFCTMLLGDQGAEVIKIEEPTKGDDTRSQSNPKVNGENTAFLAINRNKKSVTVNLRDPAGQHIVRELARTADIFVENFRPGKADELGLGYDRLRQDNPKLIYCSISGWGQDGPYAKRGGYATTAEAAGGLMSVTGEREGGPVKVGVSIVDSLAGLFAKDAITAAIVARDRTGVGQRVDTSLLESTVAILSMVGSAYLLSGVVAQRCGSEHEWNVPWKAFKTLDGHVVFASSSEGSWQKFCNAVGKPELTDDERFRSMELRNQNRVALYAILDEIMSQRTTAEWLQIADKVNAAAAPVNTIDQVFRDPQVLHRKMVEYVDHPTLGRIPQIGHAQKFSSSALKISLAPPLLGQHTDETLRSLLEYSDAQIAELHAHKVI
jgi:crotonobetainyl-CoA:carnitine CoA-transferase CaiB-like acyl-CoA transferase